MSLLMQALKKAERAKQNHLHEDELAKPSEEFDAVLSLAPQESAPAVPELTEAVASGEAPRIEPALSLEPVDHPALSLSPLPAETPAGPMALDLTPPAMTPLAHDAEATASPSTAPAPDAGRPGAKPGPNADPESKAPASTRAQARADAPRARAHGPAKAQPKRRAAAPPRAMLDPATIRLAVLGGIALLILCIFGFLYWRAVSGPGAGSGLPMVPMPPQTITPAGTAGLIVVAPPAGAAPAGAPDPGLNGAAVSTAGADGGTAPSAAVPANTAAGAPVAPPPMETPAGPPDGAMAAQMHPYGAGPGSAATAAPAQALPSAQASPPAQALPPARPREDAPQRVQAERVPSQSRPQQPVTAINNGDIRMVRTDRAPRINPVLQDAYAAFTAGDTATAQRQYQQVQQQDPNNRDALLGLAAVALRQHQPALAVSQYLRLLELDPNDSEAASGLIGLSHGDPEQSESRLKAILQHNPSAAPVLFTLGNLYAQQGRWTDAQDSYFRAWSSDPSNADYAFNLAVGLDRLNQPKLAIGYYQRALALATNNPGTFDHGAARRRLHELSATVAPSSPSSPATLRPTP